MLDKEILKKVVSKIQSMNYGDTITRQELTGELGIIPKTTAYYAAICKLQKECLESGKMLENVIKVGYRITYPDDYSSLAVRQYKYGVRLKKFEPKTYYIWKYLGIYWH